MLLKLAGGSAVQCGVSRGVMCRAPFNIRRVWVIAVVLCDLHIAPQLSLNYSHQSVLLRARCRSHNVTRRLSRVEDGRPSQHAMMTSLRDTVTWPGCSVSGERYSTDAQWRRAGAPRQLLALTGCRRLNTMHVRARRRRRRRERFEVEAEAKQGRYEREQSRADDTVTDTLCDTKQ